MKTQAERKQEANRRWYKRHRQEQIERTRNNRSRYRKQYLALKDKPCTDCGQRFPHYVMDFDHARGTKEFSISNKGRDLSLEALTREISKCDLVCANCHRIRTHNRRCSSTERVPRS